MALDATTLALVAGELKGQLLEARIDRITQPTRDEVVLQMRSREAGFRLLLSARSGTARVCLTQEGYENPALPPTFCMLLRKHLGGGRLLDIRTPQSERIVFFDFLCVNEMGDLVHNTLAAELMGRYSNLVLFRREAEGDGGKITDALKRVDFEDSEIRQLLPGLPYTLPAKQQGLDFLTAEKAPFFAQLLATQQPAEEAVRRCFVGIGPVVAREVAYRALKGEERPAASLSQDELERLWEALEEMRADVKAGGCPNLVKNTDGKPVEFSFTPLTQYPADFERVEYPTFSALLEGYYAQKDRLERLRQKSKTLRKNVQSLYERALRKQSAREEELAESEKSDHLRLAGELLMANLHAFKKGDGQVTVQNWYDGKETTLRLDARLSPSANAQRYYKEYKKKQTAAKMLKELLKAGTHEIEYLATVIYEVDQATSEAELEEIRAELKSAGYLKHYKARQDKKKKPQDFLKYRSADGFLILVGRNNAQNERLSLKTARGKDLWFHVKNAPGSHVVVMSEGEDIPLSTQNQAAMLAVWHSSQKNSAQVPVDYTQVKNLRKTGDLPPGMVLYDHYETGYITPLAQEIEQIERVQKEEGNK